MYVPHLCIFLYYYICRFLPDIVICTVTKSIDVYCSGWLYKLEVKNMDELKALMDEKAYAEYLETYDSDDEYQPI